MYKMKSGRGYVIRKKLFPYLLMLPALIPIAVILIYPIFKTGYMSLFDIATQKPNEGVFVGLENYISIIKSESFLLGLKNTFIVTIVTVVFSVLLGLVIALALNRPLFARGLYRSVIIIPWATPAVAAVLVWSWLFDYQFGFLNYYLTSLGFTSSNIGWLTTRNMSMVSLCIVMIWKNFSIACLMLLAGLQTIDLTLYEVAEMDGANAFRKFLHITLPGIKSSASILVLLLTVWSLREFTTIKLLTNGGPARATETLVLSTYQYAFNYYKIGDASAMGMITFFISLAFSLIYFLILKRGENK